MAHRPIGRLHVHQVAESMDPQRLDKCKAVLGCGSFVDATNQQIAEGTAGGGRRTRKTDPNEALKKIPLQAAQILTHGTHGTHDWQLL